MECLIAKRPDSLYKGGRRSSAWLKIKLTRQQEFVIGGYAPPRGGRQYFGALPVGYRSPAGL
jgi:bifunctional non-homologous end joining protein LigD